MTLPPRVLCGRVAVVVKNYQLFRSPSILLLLDFLNRQQCEVVLVLENAGSVPRALAERVSVVQVKPVGVVRQLTLFRLRLQKFDNVLAFEPHGFHLAAKFAPIASIIYYSLELYLQRSHPADYPESIARFERQHINEVAGVIIQSDERLQLFASDYHLDSRIPTFLLPVCAAPSGDWAPRRLSPAGGRSVLHFGGLKEELGVPQFCESVSRLKGWTLVLHGHVVGEELSNIRAQMGKGLLQNVRVDNEYFDLPDQAERICDTVDVGLAWYAGGRSPNLDTASLSSGKIAVYLKHGLPIIVRRGGSFVDVLERAGCAVAIDSPRDLLSALADIEANYDRMSERSRQMFAERYDFARYEKPLGAFLLQTRTPRQER